VGIHTCYSSKFVYHNIKKGKKEYKKGEKEYKKEKKEYKKRKEKTHVQ
jgi:hypothetical protein